MFEQIFPNWKRVVRNAVAVAGIALVANYQNIYPPTLQTISTAVIAGVIAFIIEFTNAYKNKPKPKGHRQNMHTFFLS